MSGADRGRSRSRRYSFPLDPPFLAAWDPEPRTTSEASLAIARADDGLPGIASGDHLPDVALLSALLVGLDPLRTEVVRELCETVDFHGGRPWIAEVAVWDLAGRALGRPLWQLLGGRRSGSSPMHPAASWSSRRSARGA